MKKFSYEFWEQVRLDYEAGISQKIIRDKYGLRASTLNSQVKRNGWQQGTRQEKLEPVKKIVELKSNSSYAYNAVDANKVKSLVIAGFDSLEISNILDISHSDIVLHYVREIETAFQNATTQIAITLYKRATDPEGGSAANQAAKLWHELYANKQGQTVKPAANTCRSDIEDALVLYQPLAPPSK